LLRAGDGVLLAEGETTHVVTNAEMKTSPIPTKYLDAFREAMDK
jgi:acyl-CoA thioesterase FadM